MQITTPLEAFHYCRVRLRSAVEEFWAIALSSEKEVLSDACLFRGTVDGCLFHPRDVFRFAYLANASSILVAHNHPTGRALPSPADEQVTRRLIAAGRLLGVPLVDHLILARGEYYSFRQAGRWRERARGPVLPTDRSPD